MKRLRGATLLFTVLQAGVALGAYAIDLNQSIIGAVLAIAGFAFGILLGLLALGMLCGKVKETPGLAALVVGFLVGGAVINWGTISWPWNAPIAFTSTFVTGYVLHLLMNRRAEQS